MHGHGHSLVLAFDTDLPEFARGFELGRLWEQVDGADPAEGVDQLVHTSNAEMVLRVAEACGRTVESEEHDGVWMTVRFSAVVREEASL